METNKIIEILTKANEWRRGAEIEMPEPEEFGIAIDEAIKIIKQYEAIIYLINKND